MKKDLGENLGAKFTFKGCTLLLPLSLPLVT
jgi:hypothetical protein